MCLYLRFLGAPQILLNTPVQLKTKKALALLVYLAITHQAHSRESLATLFWPGSAEKQARGALRYTLSLLRKQIGAEWFDITLHHVSLNWEKPIEVDVLAFKELIIATATSSVQTVSTLPPQKKKTQLTEAVAYYRGDFLQGFTIKDSRAFDEWHFFEADGLQKQFATALENLILLHHEEKEWETAVSLARRWLRLDTLNEPAHYWLIKLYAQSGQRRAAIRQYEQCVAILKEELNVAPNAAIQKLISDVRQPQIESKQPTAFPEAVAKHFPRYINSFVGRRDMLAQAKAWLIDPIKPLITISGLGGVGKTRLAVELMLTTPIPATDGIVYVDLSAASTITMLEHQLAEAVGVPLKREGDVRGRILTFLQDKQMGLLLDNYEQLLPDISLIVDLLREAPNIRLVITSREALGLPQEWLLTLGGLSLGQNRQMEEMMTSPAVTLFCQRARQQVSTFKFSEEETAVYQICQLVEGVPLALELAASWVKLLSCQQILAEIERSLDILETQQRGVPDRHRTIRIVFEHSWRHLTEAEQTLLLKLAIFPAQFTVEAAVTVCETTLPLLYSLVNKSLLRRVTQNQFQMHTLLKQFVIEKQLDTSFDLTSLQRHYMVYYAHFFTDQALDNSFFGPEAGGALDMVQDLIANVWLSWEWAIAQQNLDILEQLLPIIYGFCSARGWHQEGILHFTSAEKVVRDFHPQNVELLGWVMARQGEFYYELGLLDQAEFKLLGALNLHRRLSLEKPLFTIYNLLGMINRIKGEFLTAKQWADEGVWLAQSLDDPFRTALAQLSLGAIELELGNNVQARQQFQESYSTYLTLGYEWGQAHAQRFLGIAEQKTGDWQQAQRHLQASLQTCKSIGDPTGIMLASSELGKLAEQQNKDEDAFDYHRLSLKLSQEQNVRLLQATSYYHLGRLYQQRRKFGLAKENLEKALQKAIKIKAMPIVLDIAADVVLMLDENRQAERAHYLAALVLQHSALKQETRRKIDRIQPQLAGRNDHSLLLTKVIRQSFGLVLSNS